MENNTIFNKLFAAFKFSIIIFFIFVQVLILYLTLVGFNAIFSYSYFIIHFVTIIFVFKILSMHKNYSYKVSWLTFLTLFPVTSIVFFFIFGRPRYIKSVIKKEHQIIEELGIITVNNDYLHHTMSDEDLKRQLDLISRLSGFKPYQNTKCKYYEVGETFFEAMEEKLMEAEQYILMEHFIVSDGKLFTRIYNILEEKVNAGVEVFFMYDAAGSLTTVPRAKLKQLENIGVRVVHYNNRPINFYTYINYRDHRKICVIDGKYAFTGGNNIADEYTNEIERFGHWKDMGISIEGEAVKSFINMFFLNWKIDSGDDINISDYYRTHLVDKSSYVTPFGDGPSNLNNPAKYLYMKMISSAKKYVYITTPYLVIDDEMMNTLLLAAKSGIDVRIILPGIADKKFIYNVSLAHIGPLLEAGVKIYTYTPGFVHGKTIVCDDVFSVVGSINFDARSLNWNFECGVHVYNKKFAISVREDLQAMMDVSHNITFEQYTSKLTLYRIFSGPLIAIGPLL